MERRDMFLLDGRRFFFPPRPQFFSKAYPTPLACRAGTLFSIWKVWYSERACARAHLLFLRREMAAERENFTPTEPERQVSVWKGEHVCHCMCAFVWAYKRERESCISPWEIKAGHSIHHRKTLISPLDKKGIESLFWSQAHTEQTAGEYHTWVSPQVQISLSSHQLCDCYNPFHLQSNRYSIHITNLYSCLNFQNGDWQGTDCSVFHKQRHYTDPDSFVLLLFTAFVLLLFKDDLFSPQDVRVDFRQI